MTEFSPIRVRLKDGLTLEGLLITRTDEKITVKLKNGYNIILHRDEIAETLILPEAEKAGGTGEKKGEGDALGGRTEAQRKKRTRDGKKEHMHSSSGASGYILIINTGGTIASRVEYETGAVKPGFSAEDILYQYPELKAYGEIRTRDAYSILSEDARFTHYNMLIRHVWNALLDDQLRGIIIAHGTDTMHYTAAALRFALPRIAKPIILTGSQRSSDRPSSDSRMNILNAAYLLTKWPNSLPANVYILMHASSLSEEGLLIEGIWARKMHSSRRDAFQSINKPPVARVHALEEYIHIHPAYMPPRITREDDAPSFYKEDLRIGMIAAHPNMHPDELLLYESFDGLIILGTGFGHLGVVIEENRPLYDALRRLASRIPVIMSRQTIQGVTNLMVYTAGRRIRDAGVLGHACDMTPETAFIKLAWLLSTGRDVTIWFEKPLVGECQHARSLLTGNDWSHDTEDLYERKKGRGRIEEQGDNDGGDQT